jgi:hypothetical protein
MTSQLHFLNLKCHKCPPYIVCKTISSNTLFKYHFLHLTYTNMHVRQSQMLFLKKVPEHLRVQNLNLMVQKTHPIITKHTLLPETVFLVVFRVASKYVNYDELSSWKLSVVALFFLHLWVQICLLRKILAFCFSNSHLKSPNLHLTMQFSYF